MTESSRNLLSIDYPAEFKPGALSAVTTCLRIDPAEKVTLITDRVTEPIAAALGAQLAERGCPWNVFVLEDLAGFHFCGTGSDERVALAHADDGRGEPPPHAARAHG
jgi:hypothetical protein